MDYVESAASALLTKGKTPFHQACSTLKTFVPLGSFPNQLTREACSQIITVYQQAIEGTTELEKLIGAALVRIKRHQNNRTTSQTEPTAESSEKQHQAKRNRRPDGGGQAKRRKTGGSANSAKRKALAWMTRMPKPGDQVAAKVASHELWILTTVERYIPAQDIFHVVDDDDETKKRHFKLKRSSILTFPRENEASGDLFPVNSAVMALYPNTTTFYRANISKPCIKGKYGGDICVMQFPGDDLTREGQLPHLEIPARFVRLQHEENAM